MIELHLYFFMCAMIGFVYSAILTEPDMILYPIWKFLDERLHPALFKPLMDCYKCVCGQIALWIGFVFVYDYAPYLTFNSIFIHVYFICLTIFISIILNKIYETTKGN